MALLIDARARALIARRQAQGREATILLRLVPLPGWQHMLCAEWASREGLPCDLVRQQVGVVTVYAPRRVARYARGHDVAISAMVLGPLRWLTVVDEPRVVLDMGSGPCGSARDSPAGGA